MSAELRTPEDLFAPGAPVFSVLTGTAGTGKTFALVESARADSSLLLTATTGIAAVNLGEGMTINAALGYFDTDSLREAFLAGWLHTRIRRLEDQGVKRILLDEMSMLDADQLDLIVSAILQVSDRHPIGLTLAGDFCQLPPVKAKFAFASSAWQTHFARNIVVLNEIRRQSDRDFILALQALRRGDVSERILDIIHPAFHATTSLDFDGTTLVARNEEVDRINNLRYGLLRGGEVFWPSHRWGQGRAEWKFIPQQVGVKPDALVMLLANRPIYSGSEFLDYRYINGDLGHVVDCGAVETTEAGQPRVMEPMRVKLLRTGETVEVDYVTRSVYDPDDTAKTKKARKLIGEITYLPIRHAYATTVHKSQGLTFDTVQVSIRDHFWATPAMMYVAMSRCRTLEGLRVVGTPQMMTNKTKVDPRVKAWI